MWLATRCARQADRAPVTSRLHFGGSPEVILQQYQGARDMRLRRRTVTAERAAGCLEELGGDDV